jgi:hypothetical protein
VEESQTVPALCHLQVQEEARAWPVASLRRPEHVASRPVGKALDQMEEGEPSASVWNQAA